MEKIVWISDRVDVGLILANDTLTPTQERNVSEPQKRRRKKVISVELPQNMNIAIDGSVGFFFGGSWP